MKNDALTLKPEVIIRAPSSRYLDEFVRLKCAPDLLAWRLFPNAKEITESFAAYNAARKHLRRDFPLDDSGVLVVCVGDGNTPRTGVTFACRSAWTVVSVDPRLKDGPWALSVRRLYMVFAKIEDLAESTSAGAVLAPAHEGPAIIVTVHSHALLDAAVAALPRASRLAVIAMPCCVPQVIHGADGEVIPPDVAYKDYGCLSPERWVLVWRDVRRMSREETP